MRQPDDNKTPDLLGETCDLAGPIPPPGKTKAQLRAERFRERHGVMPMTVNIDAQILADFKAYMLTRPKGTKPGDVIGKIIKSQLLRKR
jgi:hypothetical protein